MNNLELEKLEKRYFEFISCYLRQNNDSLAKELGPLIINNKDMGLFFHYFLKPIFRYPKTLPLNSCLNFELPDALIHIEVKTALIDNPSDYKGKVNTAINQTSYGVKGLFVPNLPQYYSLKGNIKKPCLTYIIQIIHEHAKPNIKALKLVCIPNGQLYSSYGKSIVGGGKTKGKSFRYVYSAEPYFKLLAERYKEKVFRIELIYLAKGLKPKDITNLSDVPVHFQF